MSKEGETTFNMTDWLGTRYAFRNWPVCEKCGGPSVGATYVRKDNEIFGKHKALCSQCSQKWTEKHSLRINPSYVG